MRRVSLEHLLLTALLVVWALTGINPPSGHSTWLLEVAPGLLGVTVLAATHRRFRFSRWVYVGVFLHCLILTYGGVYTYAETPLGNWIRDSMHLQRNPYDRLGHLAQGFFPAFVIREILLRTSPLVRGKWLNFITGAICLAVSALYELMEWWAALLFASNVGQTFLGTQGDEWDTQWDMLCCLIGATLALLLGRRAHDRSMRWV